MHDTRTTVGEQLYVQPDEPQKNSRFDVESFYFGEKPPRQELIEQSQIVDIHDIGEVTDSRDGYIRRLGFRTAAGYAYAALVGVPYKQETEIPVMYTTAWWTSTEGHNERTARNLMRLGNVVMMVGAEGSWHDGRLSKPETKITLSGSAAATLRFTQEVIDDYKYFVDPIRRVLIGESRGAMVGMGILALDEDFSQDIKFADLTAPCFPRKFKPSDALLLASQIYHEPVSTAKLIGKLTTNRLLHYPGTIDANPYSVAHQVMIGPALFSGEAGDLARQIDTDKIIHITCFQNDKASMQKEWSSIFANNSNVRIVPLEGSHLSLADPQTLDYILARNSAFKQAYENNGDEIKPDDIYQVAHTLARTSNL